MNSEFLLFNLSGLFFIIFIFLCERTGKRDVPTWGILAVLTDFTVHLSQLCAHVHCAHNFVLKKRMCVYILKKKVKYIVSGQYLSKVLEHICLTLWVQFTEMKWPSPVGILHCQHLLMLENWGTQHLAKSGPNYAAWGWGKTQGKACCNFSLVLRWSIFKADQHTFTQLMFLSYSGWSISHRCQSELNWTLAS